MTEQEEKSAKRIGRNITNLLIEHEKTQQQLADAIGVSKSTVSTWVNGKRIPRMNKVDAMCRFFGVPRSAILEDMDVVPDVNKMIRDSSRNLSKIIMSRMNEDELERKVIEIMDRRERQQYYEDEVVQAVTERLRTNPEYAVMFKAASNVKPEEVEYVTKFIEKFSD